MTANEALLQIRSRAQEAKWLAAEHSDDNELRHALADILSILQAYDSDSGNETQGGALRCPNDPGHKVFCRTVNETNNSLLNQEGAVLNKERAFAEVVALVCCVCRVEAVEEGTQP
jgi:hypothetical protein